MESLREEIRVRRDTLVDAKERKVEYKDDEHLTRVTDEQLDAIDERDVEIMEAINRMETDEEVEGARKKLDNFVIEARKSKKDVTAVIIGEYMKKWAIINNPDKREERKAA